MLAITLMVLPLIAAIVALPLLSLAPSSLLLFSPCGTPYCFALLMLSLHLVPPHVGIVDILCKLVQTSP